MRWLEHNIPPPVVAALMAAAMWVISRVSLVLSIDARWRLLVAALFFVSGSAFALLAIMAFRRARTTINPHRPQATSALVVTGIYRHTRNPMYVGVVAVLIGWGVYLAAPLALLGPVAFILYITRFQIIPEERVLSAKFGDQFSEYYAKVRRWL